MTKSLLLASILAALALSASAQGVSDIPKPATAPFAPVVKDAHCWPKEAGGTGTRFAVKTDAEGTVYTWLCGSEGVWIGSPSDNSPKNPIEAKALLGELKRLEVMQGYSFNPNQFKAKAQAQLTESRK